MKKKKKNITSFGQPTRLSVKALLVPTMAIMSYFHEVKAVNDVV